MASEGQAAGQAEAVRVREREPVVSVTSAAVALEAVVTTQAEVGGAAGVGAAARR